MGRLIGVDGLDGVGKTTFAKELARSIDGEYMYFNEGNILAPLRKQADELSLDERFAYYLSVNLMNIPRFKRLKETSEKPIVLDRTPMSTYAYHADMENVDTSSYLLLHDALMEVFDSVCYVHASDEVRRQRMLGRLTEEQLHKFDAYSLQRGNSIHVAYLSLLAEGAISLDSSNTNVNELVAEGKSRLKQNGTLR